jgi:hypothetical protein
MKIENRDPHGIAISPTHNSGSIRPTPNVGPHNDPRAGGQVSPKSYAPLPISDRSAEVK